MRGLPDDVRLVPLVHHLEPGVLQVHADVFVLGVHADLAVRGQRGGGEVGGGQGLVRARRLEGEGKRERNMKTDVEPMMVRELNGDKKLRKEVT